MSKIFKKAGPLLFGHPAQSDSQSSSNNQAYPMLAAGLGGQVENSGNASNSIANLLGIGGDPAAQQQAFQTFRDSTGYQFGMDQGMQAITGSKAAKGLLNSGSTAKALNTFGQNYANTQYEKYLNPLQSLIGSGNNAAGTIAQAGQQSQSTGSEEGKKKGLFGSIASNAAKAAKAGAGAG